MRRREFITLVGGAAATWPLVCHAQQPLPLIGYVSGRSAQSDEPFVTAFRRALGEQGITDGKSVRIEYRWADNNLSQASKLAAELIDLKPAVLVVGGGALVVLAAKKLTSTIPIVFITGADPIKKLSLVTSLSRPTGNVTGVSFLATQIVTKRLDLLSELVPKARAIAVLVNPNNPDRDAMARDLEQAGRTVKFSLKIFRASNEGEIDAAFAEMGRQNVDALLIGGDNYFNSVRRKLSALALRHALPAMFDFREFAAEGGLMSYGASQTDAYRQGANYVSRILGGAKPVDLPVIQSSRFELVINLATAKALRLEVPAKLIALADEVIE